MTTYPQRIVLSVFVFAAAAMGWIECNPPAASAAPIGAGYALEVTSSDRVLAAMGTSMEHQIIMDESCDNPHLRIRARNKPSLKLTNTSTTASAASIQTFTLAINSNDYLFGEGDTEFDSYSNGISVSPFSDSSVQFLGSSVSEDGKSLTVNFSGLAPGKTAIFNVDLDARNAAMFPYPDFRSVLLGAPMAFGDAPTTPATSSAVFSGDPTPLSQNFTQITEAPVYANERIRPYHNMDMVEVFGTGPTGTIPEPTAGLIALVAATCLGAVRQRS